MSPLRTSLYRPPFYPAMFYCVPSAWLEDVMTTGALDARDLLLFMHDGNGSVIFPLDQPESYWTRDNDEGLPNIVSHVTYRQQIEALIQEKRLAPLDDNGCYQMLDWDRARLGAVMYRPREYVTQRWPAWLGKNNWGPRAALVGLMALMSRQGRQDEAGTPYVIATTRQIRSEAQMWLPAAPIGGKVGEGLRQLLDLGVIDEVSRSRKNITYRLRADAFERLPRWTSEEVAGVCGLDPHADAHWAELILAFLTHNCRPLSDAPEVWAAIRRHDPEIATADDAKALIVELEQRAGHAATSVGRVLRDFVKRRRAEERRWVRGEEFAMPLGSAVESPPLTMPTDSPHRVQATQLVIQYERGPRLSIEEAIALARGVQIDVVQGDQIIPLTRGLRADRYAIRSGNRVDANHLHERLDYERPFAVRLTAERWGPLTLRCHFRARVPDKKKTRAST